MSEFYEPWVPAVGERVRYVYRHECPGVYGMVAPVGHPPEFDGQDGTMYEIYRGLGKTMYEVYPYGLNETANGHRFLVRLDSGRHIMAAALELEPAHA